MGSKKQKDKADRRRLEFLARLTQQLDQRTDRMGLRLAELDESQGTLAGQVARLGERLERLDERQTEVAGVLSEAMAQAREAKGLAEHPPGLEELREHLASLRSEGEGVARLLQGITSGLEGLHQALDEERGRVQSLAARLEALDQIQRGLLEREQGLRDALEALRKDSGAPTGTPDADPLDDLARRLEAAVARWDEETRQWEEAQETLASGLEVLQARVDHLEPQVQEGERLLRNLGDDLKPLAQGLAEARRGLETQEAFREETLRRLDTLERRLGGEVEALRDALSLEKTGNQRHSERLEVLEALSEGLQARIDHLADEHQADVDGLDSRLQELEKRAGIRDQGMLHLARAIAGQGKRIGELQMETREQKSRFQDLEQELDQSGVLLEETRRRVEDQGGRLRRLGVGQRILGVTAGVAVFVLLAVMVAGYWFEGQRRELEHRSVARDLDRMERRLAKVAAGGPAAPQAPSGRSDDKAGGVDPVVARLEARQRRTEATLDRLRATLVRLEDRRRQTSSPASLATSGGTGGPPRIVRARPEAPADLAAGARPQDSPWRLAQKNGGFGIQIMGVRSLDRLHALVEREGLLARVAWYRTDLGGKPWYVVFFGPFPDEKAARAALKDLPEALRGGRPWVRRLPAGTTLHTW